MAEKINILSLYNICRELVLKAEKTAAVNGGKVDESLLPPLKEAFEKVIEFEKLHLITAHDVFYGTMLMNMDTKIDFTIRGPLDLDVRKDPVVLVFNPLFLAKYKYAEFTGLVISEILRLTYSHPTTFAEINSGKEKEVHQLLEKASSATVSSMVQNDIRLDKKDLNKKLILPPSAYTTNSLVLETGKTPKRDSSLDYYYKFLKNFAPKQSDSPGNQPNNINQQGAATENNTSGKEPHQWEDANDETKERIKSMVSEVYNSMDERTRGNMPGSLVEQIKQLLKKPEITWKQVLRKYVGAIPVPNRKTKMRLNRRQPERPDLSGHLPKHHIELLIAIDTSGSMSSEDISYVINEIFHIVKDYDTKITIIECDAEIGKIYEAKRPSDVQTKVSGRGGTSFLPVIEHINETGKYTGALLIYFTDGYGDSEIPRPRTLRNLWVVIEDEKYLSVKEPYGEVKALRKDEGYKKMKDGI
jgi:predicted metal-dependent peptidase